MVPIFLGVDVAGKENTWVLGLSKGSDGLNIVHGPHRSSLQEIVTYCESDNVLAIAIDAQLTIALSEEDGFRESDRQLRQMLPAECRNWVASVNSLMAVPVRGRLLAESLMPIVGTILETHPRASLLFGLDQTLYSAIKQYKKKEPDPRPHVATLWQRWSQHFGINDDRTPTHDGALDSLVCATVAYLFHHHPAQLIKLKHTTPNKTGYGPFYVIAPPNGGEVNLSVTGD